MNSGKALGADIQSHLIQTSRRWLVLILSLLAVAVPIRVAAQCVTAPSGLVGWWPGDGGATNYFGTNNATLVGGATASGAGLVLQGFTFNGTNNYVSVPDSAFLKPTNFTLEAWVKFDSLESAGSAGMPAGLQFIVFKQNSRSTYFEGFLLGKNRNGASDNFFFAVTSASGVQLDITSTTAVSVGTWYHVACVRTPNTIQLFVNGQLQAQTNVAFAQSYGTLPMYFGTSGQSGFDKKFKGVLDEVSLYNRPLASNEISAIFSAGAAGKCKAAGALTITAQPQNQTVTLGSNAIFSVAASGLAPLAYQWRLGGVAIANATNTSLTLANVQPADGGSYTVVVTNSTGSVTSSVATLTVLVPPTIALQPQSQTNIAGGIVSFNATATGSATLAYQWRLNGSPLSNNSRISGATTSALTISNLLSSDAGDYTLRVTNAAGVAISDIAALTVNGPPVITMQPTNVSVAVGANAGFLVAASGTQPLNYQWRFSGTDIPDATNAAFTITDAQPGNGGSYAVVVANPVGSVTSSVATLTVLLPPGITSQPQSQTNLAGTTALFTTTSTGSAPLSFRWLLNGTTVANNARITGATTGSLSISNVQSTDAGSYTMIVTNVAGAATSSVANLTVISPPTITGQPVSISVNAGSNASFFASASGTAPLSFQWRRNGTNLSDGGNINGATISQLLLSAVQTNDAGSFQLVVTNIAGAITSAVATLTVNVSGGCSPATAGIVGWWPGDGTAADIAGVNNGVLQGGATAAGVGQVGFGFTFNGTNNYVSIPDSTALKPTNLTLEAWVKFDSLDSSGTPNTPNGLQFIVFKQNTRNNAFEGYLLAKTRNTTGDRLIFAVTSASGQQVSVASTTFVQAGVWYHVAGVRGPNTLQIYINGQMQAQASVTAAQNYGTLPLYFGTSGQSNYDRKFKGVLDEVSLYNRALSGAEIASIFTAAAAGKCKGASAPAIITQPISQIYTQNSMATFSVVATGTAPLSYQWYRDGFLVFNDARTTGATNTTLAITALQPGDIGNYTVIISNSVGTVQSAVASLNTGLAPGNDNFASATSVGGTSGTVNGNNANATKQTGEPTHAGNAGGSSVWYNWTAPSASPVTIDTTMSAFDTLLAVYTGTAVNALTPIANNNNISTNNSRSRVSFTPVAGTVYRIAVDGANGANGNITLRWVQSSVAVPDLIILGSAVNPRIVTESFTSGSCAVAEGLVPAGTRRLIRFDTQTVNQGGADLFFGNPASNPLFVYAPCHAHYHFQNYMSYRLRNAAGQIVATGLKVGFCVLDVFRYDSGSAPNALYTCVNQGIQKGWGDLYDSTLDGQWIDITGLPDGNYTMEMEANPLGIIQESNYGNNVTIIPITIGNSSAPPPNNNFTGAQTLLGTSPSVTGTTTNATKEGGEPNHAGNAGGASVWYNWTAPATKAVTIDTVGSSFNTLLGVYTGNAVGGLSLVASNDDIVAGSTLQSRVTFNATAGTVYRIAVDGFGGASGNIIVTVNQTVANDAFAACIFTGGVLGSISGSSVGATKETGEPNHGSNAGGHSIWYCWTAPVGGTVTFDTVGSTFNTTLAVYTGNSVGALTLAAGNDDIGAGSNLQSRVTFAATGLTMYRIAIDGFNGDSGNTMLNWTLSAAAPALASLASFNQNLNLSQATAGNQAVLGFNLLPEGMFQLAIKGRPQQRYYVERSCDLVHWIPLAPTVADVDGQAWFTDKAARHLQTSSTDSICGPGQVLGVAVSATEARFYRVLELP